MRCDKIYKTMKRLRCTTKHNAQCTMHTVVPHVLAWLAWLSCSHALIACHKRTRGAFLHFCISQFSVLSASRSMFVYNKCFVFSSCIFYLKFDNNSSILFRHFARRVAARSQRHWTLDIGHWTPLRTKSNKPGLIVPSSVPVGTAVGTPPCFTDKRYE